MPKKAKKYEDKPLFAPGQRVAILTKDDYAGMTGEVAGFTGDEYVVLVDGTGEDLLFKEDKLMVTPAEYPAVDPAHYSYPGGAQVIDITRHMGFLEGNVVKYVARAGRKGDKLEDLLKAKKYLEWAIEDAQS
jgi:hypothetical protein